MTEIICPSCGRIYCYFGNPKPIEMCPSCDQEEEVYRATAGGYCDSPEEVETKWSEK